MDEVRQTILIIEDELDIQEMISFNLRQEGYRVFCSSSGEDGVQKAIVKLPQLIILDLMLPGLNGLEVCRRIRQQQGLEDVKIIMLTAKSEESDVVAGLEIGADDYLTKPFSNRILLARIHSLLRRNSITAEKEKEEVLHFNQLVIHPGRREVVLNGHPVELTASEFRALHLMARRPGWVFTRYQIVDGVHGTGHVVTGRAIDVLLVSLRKKLGEYATCVETVRGAGYRFRAP